MRSSIILTALCAGLAIAGPHGKRVLVTDTITETVIVYITEEPGTPATKPAVVPTHSAAPVVPTTSATPVVVAPVSTVAPPPPPPVAVVKTTAAAPSAAQTSAAASPPSSNSCPGTDAPTDYASTATYWHNVHRCNHTAPAVSYNTQIAGYAATLAATCNFHHDVSIGGGGYGQNIASYGATGAASLKASDLAAEAISNYWYNGELASFLPSYYGQANPDMSNFDAWGHFSQVVWSGSTSVGCATHFCKAGSLFSGIDGWFTVCNYEAQGNMGGAYGSNINKPNGHPSTAAN